VHDELFLTLARRGRPGRYNPNVDVFYDADGRRLVVHVELAGADPDSLSVAVDENDLHIVGRRVDRSDHSCGSMLQKEIEYGEFGKRIQLPAPVDVEETAASYSDGILTITLPLSAVQNFPMVRTVRRMTIRRIPA
jgi:HSP20 family protein